MPARRKLTEKETRFIDLYLKCLVAAEAAREAGYSIRTARSIAHELMKKPKIKSVIDAALEQRHREWEIEWQKKIAADRYGVSLFRSRRR